MISYSSVGTSGCSWAANRVTASEGCIAKWIISILVPYTILLLTAGVFSLCSIEFRLSTLWGEGVG